jgi:hypothetical protein
MAARAQQPTLLEQMKARRQQEEEARMQKEIQQSQLQTADVNRQHTQMQMQAMQDEIQQRQAAAQRQQKVMELLNQYKTSDGNPDYRRASRAAFGAGAVDIAKEIQGMANTSQKMDQRDAQMRDAEEEAAPKPMSPEGKQQYDVDRGFVSPERVRVAEEQEKAVTGAKVSEARVKQQDSAAFDLAQIFGFDQEEPPENIIEIRERYIDLVNSVGTAKAQAQIKQEYQPKGGLGGLLGFGGLEKVPEPPKQYTMEEAKQLPSGTVFYDTNGVRRKKP